MAYNVAIIFSVVQYYVCMYVCMFTYVLSLYSTCWLLLATLNDVLSASYLVLPTHFLSPCLASVSMAAADFAEGICVFSC